MKERQVAAGGVIYREGYPGNAVFVVQEGEVEILRKTDGEVRHNHEIGCHLGNVG